MAWETVATKTVGADDSGLWSDFYVKYAIGTKAIGYSVAFVPGGSSSGGWYVADDFYTYRYRVISQSYPEFNVVMENTPTNETVGIIKNTGGKLSNKQTFLVQRELKAIPPGTVTPKPYSTAGNGGRRIVRLDNDTLIASVKNQNLYTINLYKSIDSGKTWSELVSIPTSVTVYDYAIQTDGKRVFVVFCQGNNNISCRPVNEDGVLGTLTNAEPVSQTALGNVSLAINPQRNELHAVWNSRNSAYPNSFNIRYAKGMINGDGSVTWDSVEQVTTVNYSNNGLKNPCIVINSQGNPVVFMEWYNTNSVGNYGIYANTRTTNGWSGLNDRRGVTVFGGEQYIQSFPSAVVDKDGVIHVAWHGMDSIDTVRNNIRYSKSNDGGVTWSTPIKLTTGNSRQQSFPSITTDRNNALTIVYEGQDSPSYNNLHQMKFVGNSWREPEILTKFTSNAVVYPSTLYDTTFTGTFGDTPPTIYMHSQIGSVEYIGSYTTNNAPTLMLNTTDNQTLYENDTILLDGQALDVNNGDIVNVKYSIDGGTARAITTAISNGTTPVPFSKHLQFIKGILYDEQTALTGVLSEGNAHNIKVWAEDDKGGKSAEKVITFHVVANRAPLITVDSFIAVSDLINNDSITITGETSDPEGQEVKIRYNLNSGPFTEFFNAEAGPFSLNVSLDKLRDGLNTLQLQVEDSYGFITSKTLNVNKVFNSTPILNSVARYKNILPVGGIVGMVSWIESMDGDLDVNMSASMVMSGEQESFEEMSLTNSAPTGVGIQENEFVIQTDTKKDNVSIKIGISRTEVSNDKAVKRITGALQT